MEKFPCFKIIIDEVSDDSSFYNGKQFTLYLDESFEGNDELEKILKDMRKVLLENNIKPGIIPKPDAPLLEGDFFSLRNDGTKTFNLRSDDDYHFKADAVGAHYNPLHAPNPYKKLLTQPDPTFDLIKHFNNFEPRSAYDVYQALGCTCIAFLTASISKNESLDTVEAEIDQAMSSKVKLDSKPIDQLRLKAYCLGSRFIGMPQLGLFTDFMEMSFTGFYTNDQFGVFLKYVDNVKKELPRTNQYSPFHSGCSTLCFGNIEFRDLNSLLEGIQETLKGYEDLEKYLADKKQTTSTNSSTGLFTPKAKDDIDLPTKKNKNHEYKINRRKSV